MADIFGARQQMAGSLSSSFYQDTTYKSEPTQPFELVSATAQSTNDYIPSRGRFKYAQNPIKLIFVGNGPHQADDEPSVEKRPMGDPGESGHRTKKQMQRRGTDSGDGGGGSKGKGKAPPPDGPRYPPQGATSRRHFECPFHKHSPDCYYVCKGKCMPRISDVTNHLKRRHLLLKVAMGTNTQPQDIVDYCPRCRVEFHGFGAEGRLRDHLTQGGQCQEANTGQTGVMLPSEFDELKRELRSASNEVAKWFIIWRKCFLQTALPSSPYVETTVPQTHTSGLSSVNYSMAGDGTGLCATQSTHTGSLLTTTTEPHINTSIQTRAEQPAPRSVYITPAYTSSQDYNTAMPPLLSTFLSSSDLINRAGPELIGGQAGWNPTALDQTYHFLDLGMQSTISIPDAGHRDLDGLLLGGDDWYHDGYAPHWSANNHNRSQT